MGHIGPLPVCKRLIPPIHAVYELFLSQCAQKSRNQLCGAMIWSENGLLIPNERKPRRTTWVRRPPIRLGSFLRSGICCTPTASTSWTDRSSSIHTAHLQCHFAPSSGIISTRIRVNRGVSTGRILTMGHPKAAVSPDKWDSPHQRLGQHS